MKTCPSCARENHRANLRCACGFELPGVQPYQRSSEIPLSLSAERIQALVFRVHLSAGAALLEAILQIVLFFILAPLAPIEPTDPLEEKMLNRTVGLLLSFLFNLVCAVLLLRSRSIGAAYALAGVSLFEVLSRLFIGKNPLFALAFLVVHALSLSAIRELRSSNEFGAAA